MVFEVEVTAGGGPAAGVLSASFDGRTVTRPTPTIEEGKRIYEVTIPIPSRPADAVFVLESGGATA